MDGLRRFLTNDRPEGPYCHINKCEYLAKFRFECAGVPTHVAMTCEEHVHRGILDHVDVCVFEISVWQIAEDVSE